MIIQNKRNLTIHISIDEAKKYLQNYVLNNANTLKEGEILHTRYKSRGGVYDLTATLYINTGGIPYCVFNEIPQQLYTNDNLKNDIIKIHVVYQTSDEIKKVILGKPKKSGFSIPEKNPFNFVVSKQTELSFSLGLDEHNYILIESMNFPKWLHDFSEDNPFNSLHFDTVYVPRVLYVVDGENQRGINVYSLAYDLINSVCAGFTYNNDGGIFNSKPQADPHSYLIKNPNGIAYKLQDSKTFLDSTLFFNQAMQGKYFPIMNGGELKYLHFIAEFTTPTFYG